MQKSRHDVWIGLFVMLGAAAIVFLALKAGNLLSLSFDETYQVVARFDNIGGLKSGAAVKSAGVVVGREAAQAQTLLVGRAAAEAAVVRRVALLDARLGKRRSGVGHGSRLSIRRRPPVPFCIA